MENTISFGWTIFIAALPSTITAIVSLIVAFRSLSLTKQMHDESQRQTREMHDNDQRRKENEKRIADAKQKLEAFYYPYLLIAKENTSLYEVFRKEHFAKDPGFRTLPALLEGKEFSQNDEAILNQIIENDKKLKDLINQKAQVIEDKNLREDLIRSATHYAIIELAHAKKINGEVERFRPYVHPNEVYEKVMKKTRELEKVIEDADQ